MGELSGELNGTYYGASIDELEGDVVFVVVGEDRREEDVVPFFESLRPVLEERAPAQVLVDASRLGPLSFRMGWTIARRMHGSASFVRRTSIFGLSSWLETALWLLFSVRRKKNIRTFLWRHEAETWLREGSLP